MCGTRDSLHARCPSPRDSHRLPRARPPLPRAHSHRRSEAVSCHPEWWWRRMRSTVRRGTMKRGRVRERRHGWWGWSTEPKDGGGAKRQCARLIIPRTPRSSFSSRSAPALIAASTPARSPSSANSVSFFGILSGRLVSVVSFQRSASSSVCPAARRRAPLVEDRKGRSAPTRRVDGTANCAPRVAPRFAQW